MDLMSLALGTRPNASLSNTLVQNQQLVWNNLSDQTRNTLMTSSKEMALIVPQATRSQVERVKAMVGEVFDHRQIESLTDLYSLQTSNAHTGRTTLAHPTFATMHRLGQTDAYGEEYNALRNNLLYERIISGFGGLEGNGEYVVRNYADNYQGELLADYNSLSTFSKQTIHRNWNTALAAVFEDGVDVMSIHDGTF